VLSDIGGAVVNPVATDTIWDAAGDIIYGTGSNTGARLAKGTATQVLTMNAGATAPEWATGGVGDASVTQAKLKTSQGSVSIAVALSSSGITASLPGGEYGFTLQTKGTDSWVGFAGMAVAALTASYAVPGASFTNSNSMFSKTGYAQQRYVTSSGEVHWVFILRDIETKEIRGMWQAPDHPCFGNGGKPLQVPHPFGSYDPLTQEIVVINPTHEEVENMKKEGERGEDESDKDLLEVIMENYNIDEASKPKWPSIPVTVGLPKDYEMKAMGAEVITIKKVIPQPEGVLVKKLRRK